MNLKALLAAPIAAWLMMASASTIEKPMNWSYGSTGKGPDSYQMGVDASVTWNGKPALTVQAAGQRSTATGDIHNYVSPEGYEGKRLRFSGMLKMAGVDGWAGVYLAASDFRVRNFDVSATPPGSGGKGDWTQWQPVSVVVDVPREASSLRMGLMMVGNGQAWLSDLKFEEVGTDVPVTSTKVEIDQAQVAREREEMRLAVQKKGKSQPNNLELRTH